MLESLIDKIVRYHIIRILSEVALQFDIILTIAKVNQDPLLRTGVSTEMKRTSFVGSGSHTSILTRSRSK